MKLLKSVLALSLLVASLNVRAEEMDDLSMEITEGKIVAAQEMARRGQVEEIQTEIQRSLIAVQGIQQRMLARQASAPVAAKINSLTQQATGLQMAAAATEDGKSLRVYRNQMRQVLKLARQTEFLN